MIEEYTITVIVQDILNELEDGVSYIIDIQGEQHHYKWRLFKNSEIMFHCDFYGNGTQEEFNDLTQMEVKVKMFKTWKNDDDDLQEGVEMYLGLR